MSLLLLIAILRVLWPDRIRSNDLWRITGQSNIANQLLQRKWKWIGHSLRKMLSDITKAALDWCPQGSRRRGRPANTWRRSIDNELEKIKKSWPEVKATAPN